MLKINDTAIKLQAARDLIADKHNWCTGILNKKEGRLGFKAEFPFFGKVEHTSFCARGAVMQVLGINQSNPDWSNEQFQALDELLCKEADKIIASYGRFKIEDSIVRVNNSPILGGHAAVLRCFDAAIKEAMEDY